MQRALLCADAVINLLLGGLLLVYPRWLAEALVVKLTVRRMEQRQVALEVRVKFIYWSQGSQASGIKNKKIFR